MVAANPSMLGSLGNETVWVVRGPARGQHYQALSVFMGFSVGEMSRMMRRRGQIYARTTMTFHGTLMRISGTRAMASTTILWLILERPASRS